MHFHWFIHSKLQSGNSTGKMTLGASAGKTKRCRGEGKSGTVTNLCKQDGCLRGTVENQT